jgi:hypothetical protein
LKKGAADRLLAKWPQRAIDKQKKEKKERKRKKEKREKRSTSFSDSLCHEEKNGGLIFEPAEIKKREGFQKKASRPKNGIERVPAKGNPLAVRVAA